ncbi:MAG: molybdenum cofactor guanylyltransferase [Clostridium sp.]
MSNKTLAILAGGKSSRMNYNNKAFLNYKEKTFIENIMENGKEFKEIIIIANDKEPYERFGVKVFSDIHLGNGPISGIHSALLNCSNEKCLCIACDMPITSGKILNGLSKINEDYEILIPKLKDKLQPLCAIYSKSIASEIEENIRKGNNKLQRMIINFNYKVVQEVENKGFEDRDFFNINTPIELKELEEK